MHSASLNAHPLCSPQGHFQTFEPELLSSISFFTSPPEFQTEPFIPTCASKLGGGHKKQEDVLRHPHVQKFGWKMGFEPTTLGTTILYSNQLSYIHHLICFPNRCANIHTFFLYPKFFNTYFCLLGKDNLLYLTLESLYIMIIYSILDAILIYLPSFLLLLFFIE